MQLSHLYTPLVLVAYPPRCTSSRHLKISRLIIMESKAFAIQRSMGRSSPAGIYGAFKGDREPVRVVSLYHLYGFADDYRSALLGFDWATKLSNIADCLGSAGFMITFVGDMT